MNFFADAVRAFRFLFHYPLDCGNFLYYNKMPQSFTMRIISPEVRFMFILGCHLSLSGGYAAMG